MRSLPFSALYLCCLATLVGVIQLLQGCQLAEVETAEPEPVEDVAIAVPPRPDGVRPITGDEGYRYTEAGCRKLDGEYRDICFHQLARQRAPTDLSGALTACGEVAGRDLAMECTADIAELHAATDREAALALCPDIPRKKWRDQCVFGIALALSEPDPRYAFALCSQAGKWLDFCRHDVVGEIAQRQLPIALELCGAEEGDHLRRKTCFHGIGKYLGRVDVERSISVCGEIPRGPEDAYVMNCIHGVGWAGSEQHGEGFVGRCQRLPEHADACLLGIAYNLRRFDVDAALRGCAEVADGERRTCCEAYAREGVLPQACR